jgi:hypothetical protein
LGFFADGFVGEMGCGGEAIDLERRRGACSDVSFLSQFFSMPAVTERKIRTSQTTREITRTDINEIRAVESDFFLGIRYLRATLSSNKLT